jgi:hypothetical protein
MYNVFEHVQISLSYCCLYIFICIRITPAQSVTSIYIYYKYMSKQITLSRNEYTTLIHHRCQFHHKRAYMWSSLAESKHPAFFQSLLKSCLICHVWSCEELQNHAGQTPKTLRVTHKVISVTCMNVWYIRLIHHSCQFHHKCMVCHQYGSWCLFVCGQVRFPTEWLHDYITLSWPVISGIAYFTYGCSSIAHKEVVD